MVKIINFIKTAIKETDTLLFFMCLLTSAFGILMVHSATLSDKTPDALYSRDVRAMVIAVGAGVLISIVVSFVDYNFITKMFPFIGAVCLGLMLLTFAIGVGPEDRPDAKTWIVLGGTGLFFQSSELLKIGFIITFGMHIELVRDNISKLSTVLLLCFHGAIPVVLVTLSGDMGSALVFLIIFAVMMFCAEVRLRYFVIGAAAVCAAAPAAWYFVFDNTQRNRILGLFFPERYTDVMFQQNHGIEAIKAGGFTGAGLFKGTCTQTPNYIPEAENDMIFTVICEELGFVGGLLALGLLFAIIVKAIYNGKRSKNGATALMCYGMAAMIAGQVVINVGMCLKILPVIGITLPFFSAGGSSNLCIYIGIGLLMSIYRFDQEKQATEYRISNAKAFSTY